MAVLCGCVLFDTNVQIFDDQCILCSALKLVIQVGKALGYSKVLTLTLALGTDFTSGEGGVRCSIIVT